MSKENYFLRYYLIYERLLTGYASFDEIKSYLLKHLDDFEYSYSIRTFQRDINEIRRIFNYAIDIVYDRSLGKYKIFQLEQTKQIILKEDFLRIIYLLELSKNRYAFNNILFFESREMRGTYYIFKLLDAIRRRKVVQFEHYKYQDNENVKQKTVEPLALKEHMHRWYLIAKERTKIKVFGLDRIQNLLVLNQSFNYPEDFSVEELFKYSFGVILPDENDEIETIELKFDYSQGLYVESFPLHWTQKVKEKNKEDETITIELQMYITYDFIQELMKYGSDVEVIKPKFLKKTLKNWHKDALK